MRIKPVIAALAAACLLLSGCSGKEQPGTSPVAGMIRCNAIEPEAGLLPSEAADPVVGKLAGLIYGQLTTVDHEGKVVNELAESIVTKDSRAYTITVKKGLKFSDGEPITAASFADAWNYAAAQAGDAATSVYFAPIEGYAEVLRSSEGKTQAPAPGATAPAAPAEAGTTKLAGVKVVNELTLSVRLTNAESDFPTRLASPVYAPLPQRALKDLAAFGQAPSASGPYQIAEGGWQAGKQLTVVPNPGYDGPRKAANQGLIFAFYPDLVGAYDAFGQGRLDVIDQLPASELPGFATRLGARAVAGPIADLRSITIPARLEHFAGKEGQLRRQAISLAIDRSSIVADVLDGAATPATDFTSPVVLGWSGKLTGSDVLSFDPPRAKQLWEQANRISAWDGPFIIAYNTDGNHAEWVAAVLRSIQSTLGIPVKAQVYPTLSDLQAAVQSRQIKVPYRASWRADHPSAYNFLAPTYSSQASQSGGFNDGDYSSAAFDEAIAQAAAAGSLDKSLPAIQRAEELLLRDLPGIPLWDQDVVAARSARVGGLALTWDGTPDYPRLTLAAS